MGEVFFHGEISGASDFDADTLLCRFKVVTGGDNWDLLEGQADGQTQAHTALDRDDGHVWSHPIDLHYACSAIRGWPQLMVEVWNQDEFGRNALSGYGVCRLPTSPGSFNLDCVTWKPEGTLGERLYGFFLGNTPQLKNPDVVLSDENKFQLQTETSGVVYLQIEVLLRGFGNRGATFF